MTTYRVRAYRPQWYGFGVIDYYKKHKPSDRVRFAYPDPIRSFFPRAKDPTRVYFDMTADGEPIGRIIFELRHDAVPWTARNFQRLCTGQNGYGYKGSSFSRGIPQFLLQGGVIHDKFGTKKSSIYGKTFSDENFDLSHATAGTLSMVNTGPNTNETQFLITLNSTCFLDGKNVVIGFVAEGMDIVRKIESYCSQSGVMSKLVVIADCGKFSHVN